MDKDDKLSTKVVYEAFVQRIGKVIERAGGPLALSRKTKLSRAVIDKYKTGVSDPSRIRLCALANAGRVSVEWLATGQGEKEIGPIGMADLPQQGFRSEADGVSLLPMINVVASAGSGAVVLKEDHAGMIGFNTAWLSENGLNPRDLFTMPTVGESMEPTIMAGEYLLCSKAEHHTRPGDGVYVIRLEGDILVKRLQRLPLNVIEVSSDNAQFYKPFKVQLNDGLDFVILGKVVMVHGVRKL